MKKEKARELLAKILKTDMPIKDINIPISLTLEEIIERETERHFEEVTFRGLLCIAYDLTPNDVVLKLEEKVKALSI